MCARQRKLIHKLVKTNRTLAGRAQLKPDGTR